MSAVRTFSLMLALFLSGLVGADTILGQVRPDPRGGGPGFGPGRGPAGFDVDRVAASSVRFLLEKREELALTAEQQASLEQMQKALAEKNEPLLEQMRELRPTSPPRDRADMAAMRARMEQLRSVAAEVRRNNESARNEALKLLSEDQQKRAKELFEQRQEELERAGRRPGPGGVRAGRPPE